MTLNFPARILVRPATLNDLPLIVELNSQGIRSWSNDSEPALQEWMNQVCTDEHFAEMITNPHKTLLVAEYNKEPKGTIYGYPINGGRFYTGGLYLAQRGKGIATALIKEIIQSAQLLGMNELVSEVHERNHAAIRLAHINGWIHEATEEWEGINFQRLVFKLN